MSSADNWPGGDTVRAALDLAGFAPSVHNTQPWRWRIRHHGVHLYADRSRALPATDPEGRDLLISCGAVLEHARVAFAALGWRTRISRLPDPADPDYLAALQFTPQEAARQDVLLASAITRRRSDRRAYRAWPVPDDQVAELVDAAARRGAVLGRVTAGMRSDLTGALRAAAEWQRRDPRYAYELTLWSGRASGAVEGVPAANTTTLSRVGDLPLREFSGVEGGAPAADGAGELLVVGTASDDVVSRIRAGEATAAVLLRATALRLASCTLSQATEVPAARRALAAGALADGMEPQLVLRVGWPSAGPPPPATPRRPLRNVVDGM